MYLLQTTCSPRRSHSLPFQGPRPLYPRPQHSSHPLPGPKLLTHPPGAPALLPDTPSRRPSPPPGSALPSAPPGAPALLQGPTLPSAPSSLPTAGGVKPKLLAVVGGTAYQTSLPPPPPPAGLLTLSSLSLKTWHQLLSQPGRFLLQITTLLAS